MTQKRFELLINGNGQVDIIDWVASKEKNAICIYNDLGVLPYSSAKALCELLNQLYDENEQLKQYIYDNLDEDICDVCSYQYLEKSQMEKYYVAKCKKGYDNCSKGTVIHCKDFKFKELSE